MARNRITGRETQKMQEYTQERIAQAERRGIEFPTNVKEQIFEYANLIGEEEKVRTLVRNLADALSKADEEGVENLLDDAKMDIQDLPDPTIGKLELQDYGYTAEDMVPLRKEAALDYHRMGSKIYCLGSDGGKGEYASKEMIQAHEGLFGMELQMWERIRDISFEASGRNKSFILSTFAILLEQNRYKEEIQAVVNSEYWNCSSVENEILKMLAWCCSDDLNDDSLTGIENAQFKRDYLRCIKNYPEIDVEYARNRTDAIYRSKLIKEMLKIQYSPNYRSEAENAPQVINDWRNDTKLKDYLELVSLLYQKQLNRDENMYNDAVFVKNRYVRIFISEFLLPREWREDVKNLDSYLLGKLHYFSMVNNSTLQTLAIEKDAEAVSFINMFLSKDEIGISKAVSAYKAILNAETENLVKLSSYKQLFSFVKKPDDLFDIYRQVESKVPNGNKSRLSYNELLIEYGCLLICIEDGISMDTRMQILLDVFEVFEFLNEINKSNPLILERMSEAEQSVLEKPGVAFDRWVDNKDKIISILRHPAINCSEDIIKRFCIPLEECLNIVNKCTSEMQVLTELVSWRDRWNMQQNCSDYEYAFVRSVDEKIKNLKAGANLSVSVVNKTIEDFSVFFCVENKAEGSNSTVSFNNSSEASSASLDMEMITMLI